MIGQQHTLDIPAHNAGDILVLWMDPSLDCTLASIDTAGWMPTVASIKGRGWKYGDGAETTVRVTLTGSVTPPHLLAGVARIVPLLKRAEMW